MSKLIFTGREDRDAGCYGIPPVTDCDECARCPANPCGEVCAPRVRASATQVVTMRERERCFRLHAGICSAELIKSHFHCFRMEVRRRAGCDVLTVETPYKADAEGGMCVVWSDEFLALPVGYYEVDVYMDCDLVATTALFKTMPSLVLTSTPTPVEDSCAPPTCDPCCGANPQPTVETAGSIPCDTGDCHAEC